MNVEDMVDLYRQLKAKVAEIEIKHKAELAPFKLKMDQLEGHIDAFLSEHNLVNVRTKHGTAYWKTKWSASLLDPEAFMEFVRINARWELLDRKGNVTAIREFATKHSALPPGAKLESRRTVHIVKAGAAVPTDE